VIPVVPEFVGVLVRGVPRLCGIGPAAPDRRTAQMDVA
jgi:hypothetical protein